MIFLNSASSASALVFYLPGVCTHTDTTDTMGKKRKTSVGNILKTLEKNTIFIEHPVSFVSNVRIHKEILTLTDRGRSNLERSICAPKQRL